MFDYISKGVRLIPVGEKWCISCLSLKGVSNGIEVLSNSNNKRTIA